MKILDIMKNSAHLLGLTYELSTLETVRPDCEDEVFQDRDLNRMLALTRFAIQELCTNYIPICCEAKFTTNNKEIGLANITNCLKVLRVANKNGEVKFKIINRKIILENDGEYIVKYTTYPEIKSVYDDLEFLSSLSPDIAVLALCSYYSLSVGMFDTFKSFYEQYTEVAESLKQLKMFDLPTRRWV